MPGWESLSALKQPSTGADAMCPALAAALAGLFDVFRLTDPAAKVILELGGELEPRLRCDADPYEDRRQIVWDGTALVVAHRPTG